MIARSEEFDLARSLIADDEVGGVLLSGAAGIGKSYLAEAILGAVAEGGAPVWRVYGSRVTTDIPLGAIAASLPADMAGTGVAPSLALKRLLAERSLPTTVLLDDADMLDEPTAAAFVNAADAGVARLLLTQRSATLLPDSLGRATRAGAIVRIECEPFDESATIKLAEHLADGVLSPATRERIVAVTGGNPLYVREVVLAAIERGAITQTENEGLHIDSVPADATRLVDLLAERLAGVSPVALDALTRVAAAEPMSPGELAPFADQKILEQLELDGLLTMSLDDRRLQMRMAHPLFGELLRAAQSSLRLRSIRAEIAGTIASLGARRRQDRLRLATWSLDGGRDVDATTLSDASTMALVAGDLDLAVRLGRAAFARAPGFDTGGILDAALYEVGEFEPLQAHFERWEPHGRSSPERARLAVGHAVSRFWRGADADAPDELLAAAGSEEPGPHRDEMVAVAASLIVMEGRIAEGVALAEPILHGPLGRASIHATLAVGQGDGAQGHPHRAVELVDASLAAYRALGPDAVIMTYTVLSSLRVHSWGDAGMFEAADRAGIEGAEIGRDTGSTSATGLAHSARAYAALLGGRFDVAIEASRHAERWLLEARHPAMVRWTIGVRALARAQRGDRAGAIADLDGLASMPDHPAKIFVNHAHRARAWLSFLDGHHEAAFELLRASAAEATRLGNVVAAIGSWHDLARLGRPDEAAPPMEALAAAGLEGTLLSNQIAHAGALARRHPDELEACVDRLAADDTPHFAAEAADAAATVAGERGDTSAAARWVGRAAELRAAAGQRFEPSAAFNPVTAQLTKREREIATLAAQGVSSRDIGERLHISKRTVESHLGRLYPKLGVHDRAELAQLLISGRASA